MILKDMLTYLQADSTLTNALGGVDKIVPVQIPISPDSKLPYLVVQVPGGTRDKYTKYLRECKATVRITVETGPNKVSQGATIADRALRLLEGYRGLFGTKRDMRITCTEVRSDPGLFGPNKFQFEARCEWIEDYTRPTN